MRNFRLAGKAPRAPIADFKEASEATRGGIACRKAAFGLPAGLVSWKGSGAKQVCSLDSGCRCEMGDAALDILCAADKFIDTMATIDADAYVFESAT